MKSASIGIAITILIALPFHGSPGSDGNVASRVSARVYGAHLALLSDDLFEGRGTGSHGGRLAARYIAAQFARLGLEPAGDSGTFYQTFRSEVGGRELTGQNVVARLAGRGRQNGEAAVIGAHYDHLGIGPAERGDSIFNGALDNASGVAGVLALAEAFAAADFLPARQILFVAFDAEEIGLAGSAAFVRRAQRDRIVAMIDFDGMNIFARTSDTWALGMEYSSLDVDFRRAAREEGIAVRIDPEDASMLAREEFFTRSDHYSFAKAGIPALFIWSGYTATGYPAGWMRDRLEEFLRTRYHQPDDELQASYSYEGAVQDLKIVARMVAHLSTSPGRPAWKSDSPFQRQ
ncbi:MAG: M20/M25/M40 family metallo-hydrolase [Gemmatimonadota bacterium]